MSSYASRRPSRSCQRTPSPSPSTPAAAWGDCVGAGCTGEKLCSLWAASAPMTAAAARADSAEAGAAMWVGPRKAGGGTGTESNRAVSTCQPDTRLCSTSLERESEEKDKNTETNRERGREVQTGAAAGCCPCRPADTESRRSSDGQLKPYDRHSALAPQTHPANAKRRCVRVRVAIARTASSEIPLWRRHWHHGRHDSAAASPP
jgi:hypothetical protein